MNAVDNAELWGTEMPEDWMKGVLVPVCKEGDKSSCNIYKWVTLQSPLSQNLWEEFYVMK
jgi:hypothetical protein